MHAVRPLQVVINLKDPNGPPIRHFRQPEHCQRGADAVLVAHHVTDGVAEGLLIAEHETRTRHAVSGPGDPLEPGQGLGVADAAAAAILDSSVEETTVDATSRVCGSAPTPAVRS